MPKEIAYLTIYPNGRVTILREGGEVESGFIKPSTYVQILDEVKNTPSEEGLNIHVTAKV